MYLFKQVKNILLGVKSEYQKVYSKKSPIKLLSFQISQVNTIIVLCKSYPSFFVYIQANTNIHSHCPHHTNGSSTINALSCTCLTMYHRDFLYTSVPKEHPYSLKTYIFNQLQSQCMNISQFIRPIP